MSNKVGEVNVKCMFTIISRIIGFSQAEKKRIKDEEKERKRLEKERIQKEKEDRAKSKGMKNFAIKKSEKSSLSAVSQPCIWLKRLRRGVNISETLVYLVSE